MLPVVVGGDFAAYWASTGTDLAKAGMRAGLFHPTTGYSFPDAVRLAAAIADAPDLSHPALVELTRRHAERAWARPRLLPGAGHHAVPGRRAGAALPGAGALLPAESCV